MPLPGVFCYNGANRNLFHCGPVHRSMSRASFWSGPLLALVLALAPAGAARAVDYGDYGDYGDYDYYAPCSYYRYYDLPAPARCYRYFYGYYGPALFWDGDFIFRDHDDYWRWHDRDDFHHWSGHDWGHGDWHGGHEWHGDHDWHGGWHHH